MTTGNKKFAVFILTHGRPHQMFTYQALLRQGYTGPLYIIIDNEDDTAEEYHRLYGDRVITFDKKEAATHCDAGDNFNDRRAILFARNESFRIAKDLGLDFFLQLDDDYISFRYIFTSDLVATTRERKIKNLDRFFSAVVEFYASIPALTIAMGQGGDIQGGKKSNLLNRLHLKRKAMNTFFCSTKRPFQFFGRMNEDVSTYVTLGNRGDLFFTFFNAIITQRSTQQLRGGMSDTYREEGTYIKTFYSVMYAPHCVRISSTGTKHRRIHHRIIWNQAVPKILSEELRKQ